MSTRRAEEMQLNVFAKQPDLARAEADDDDSGYGSGIHMNLEEGSCCSPNEEDFARQRINASASWFDAGNFYPNQLGRKFFLHNKGAFNFTEVLACYFDIIGSREEIDLHVLPLDAEHSTDFRIMYRMATHPARTLDPDEAAFHVVGAPLNTVFLAYNLAGSPCGDGFELRRREHELAVTLQGLKQWREHPQRFLWIDTDWRVQRAYGDELLGMMRLGSILASADRVIARQYAGVNRSVVLPYKTHFLLDRAARDYVSRHVAQSNVSQSLRYKSAFNITETEMQELVEQRRLERPYSFHVITNDQADFGDEHRDTTFTFHGKLDRTLEGSMRGILKNLTASTPNASVRDVDFKNYTVEQFAAISLYTAQTMLKSRFCLVPAGDTPSSRRLFDALAAGCVPIVFEEFDFLAHNLPFRNTIRWKDIVIFAGGLNCTMNNLDSQQEWLNSLLEDSSEKQWQVERMRMLGRIVYARFLSYKSDQMITALLGEFDGHGVGGWRL